MTQQEFELFLQAKYPQLFGTDIALGASCYNDLVIDLGIANNSDAKRMLIRFLAKWRTSPEFILALCKAHCNGGKCLRLFGDEDLPSGMVLEAIMYAQKKQVLVGMENHPNYRFYLLSEKDLFKGKRLINQ